MVRSYSLKRQLPIESHQISTKAIEYSIWNSYEHLTTLKDLKHIDRYLQGYDINLDIVEKLFSIWNKQSAISPLVIVAVCAHYRRQSIWNALNKAIEDLHFESEVKAARSVFIKLGLIQGVKWSEHVTPTPIFLDVLISILREIQPTIKIQIGDGSGNERDTDLLLRQSGIIKVLKKYKDIRFVDLNMDDLAVVKVPNPATLSQLMVPKSLLDADLIISLAKLKTHKWTGVTLGMKNMFGALPGSIYGFPKNRLHWASYPRAISDIWSVIVPDLVLIDGIIGVQGNGPLNGEKVESNVIIMGKDPVATDGTAAQIMGISPHMLPTFWFASLKNLGALGPASIRDEVLPFVKSYSLPPNQILLFSSVYKTDEEQLAIIKSQLLQQETV